MSVTAEQVDAVRAAFEATIDSHDYEDASDALILFADRLRFADEVAAHPHAGLARELYARVKEDRHAEFDLQKPGNGRYWLKAAAAAFDVLGGKPVPRVFNVGDAEPDDRDTIILRGASKFDSNSREAGSELTFRFGNYANCGSTGPGGKWYQVTEERHTYASWSTWLEKYGPLTEVLA